MEDLRQNKTQKEKKPGMDKNIEDLENIEEKPNALSILIEEIIELEDEVFKNNLIQF